MKYSKIRAEWTREISDDLSSYTGVDFDESLSELLRTRLIEERREDRKNTINKIFNL